MIPILGPSIMLHYEADFKYLIPKIKYNGFYLTELSLRDPSH